MLQENLTRQLCEQHAEEAAFLWLLRDQAVHNPNYTAAELAALDDRIEAHLDGLRIGEAIAWEICEENYVWKSADECFAGAVVAFTLGDEQAIETVLNAVQKDAKLARGVISSFGWMNNDNVLAQISKMINAETPMQRRIGVGAAAILRKDIGPVLGQLLKDPSELVQARALKAAGELARVDLLNDCMAVLNSENEECRFWAAWSTALLGNPTAAIPVLKDITEAGGLYAERACDLAARRMELPQAQEWLKQLSAKPEHYRYAVIFAGAIGMPVLVPWMLQLMRVPEIARITGEMVATITGIDLIKYKLFTDAPEDFEAGPTEDPQDEMVAMDADEDLPWPDVDALSHWWETYKDHYAPNERYLLGRHLIDVDFVKQVANYGKQTHRSSAALELALSEPDAALFNACAYAGGS